jgi:hypothetical protein
MVAVSIFGEGEDCFAEPRNDEVAVILTKEARLNLTGRYLFTIRNKDSSLRF